MNRILAKDSIVAGNGFHAVMSRSVASKDARIIQGAQYRYFYNPMWEHFGDSNNSPPGTYYYENAEHVVYYWNMFDQVLVRPALLNHFQNEDLRILTGDGDVSFLSSSGRPDNTVASDHLPIVFRLNL